MQTVYAYRDAGWMSAVTRWKPRRIYCTEQSDHRDEPGIEHVVKFRQERMGTAAVISEVVCGQLLAAGRLRGLDSRLVHVSPDFAASYRTKPEIPYTIEAGLHFGTVRRYDVENGPPLRVDDLADPQELVDLWVFDTWLCNIDRDLDGNTLLTPTAGGKFYLIAADQSDCFGGAGPFADGTWKKAMHEREAAASLSFWQRAVFDSGGAAALRRSVEKVHRAAQQLAGAVSAVPAGWWQEAGINPDEVREALEQRARRLPDILKVAQWEGLDYDIQGGRLL